MPACLCVEDCIYVCMYVFMYVLYSTLLYSTMHPPPPPIHVVLWSTYVWPGSKCKCQLRIYRVYMYCSFFFFSFFSFFFFLFFSFFPPTHVSNDPSICILYVCTLLYYLVCMYVCMRCVFDTTRHDTTRHATAEAAVSGVWLSGRAIALEGRSFVRMWMSVDVCGCLCGCGGTTKYYISTKSMDAV